MLSALFPWCCTLRAPAPRRGSGVAADEPLALLVASMALKIKVRLEKTRQAVDVNAA